MTWLDPVNATFEALAAVSTWRDVAVLMRQKCIRGVDWRTRAVQSLSSGWFLVYYAGLNHWFSFVAQVVWVSGVVSWVVLARRYENG